VNIPLIKHPSAFMPLLASLIALAMVLGYVALYGITRHPNEGGPARIFQVLMLLQLPMILFFAVNWLPRFPGQALIVLCLQAFAWGVPVATIIYLES